MPRTLLRTTALLALPCALSACYVLPVAPDGSPLHPVVAVPAPAVVVPAQPAVVPVPAGAPLVLTAQLYPANDIAARDGMIAGTVTNATSGKGWFRMEYRGEVLAGEATRVDSDTRRGIASGYGPLGTTLRCDYRMTAPQQGTGTCTLSTGARYTVHLGR